MASKCARSPRILRADWMHTSGLLCPSFLASSTSSGCLCASSRRNRPCSRANWSTKEGKALCRTAYRDAHVSTHPPYPNWMKSCLATALVVKSGGQSGESVILLVRPGCLRALPPGSDPRKERCPCVGTIAPKNGCCFDRRRMQGGRYGRDNGAT